MDTLQARLRALFPEDSSLNVESVSAGAKVAGALFGTGTERTGQAMAIYVPGDTATIQKTLEPGSYQLKAGSTKAVVKEIRPAILRIGKERPNSNNDLLLP